VFLEVLTQFARPGESTFFGASDLPFSGRMEDPPVRSFDTPPAVTTVSRLSQRPGYPGYDCPLFPLPIGGVFYRSFVAHSLYSSFNLSLQRQLKPTLMVEAAYAGKIGTKIRSVAYYNPGSFINSPRDGSRAL